MSKLNDLIKEMCPNGVKYIELYKVIKWNKRFSGVNREWQKEILTLKSNISAQDLKRLLVKNGDIKLLSTGNFDGYTDRNTYKGLVDKAEVITIPSGGSANIKYYNGEFINSGNILGTSSNTDIYCLKYVYHCLLKNNELIQSYFRGSSVQHPEMKQIIQIKIPIPPIEIQKEIVRILDKFVELGEELIAEKKTRKGQYEFWRKKLLNAGNSNQQYITLGDIGKVCMCKRIMKKETSTSGDVPFYKIGTFGKQADAYISYNVFNDYKKRFSYPKKGEILVSCSGTIGRSVVFDGKDAYFQDSNIVWLSNDESKVLNKFLYYFYQTFPWNISDGGTIKRLYNNQFISAKVPLYSLKDQERIVNILESFDNLINDITGSLPAEIELRKKQYEYYRSKLLNFKEIS